MQKIFVLFVGLMMVQFTNAQSIVGVWQGLIPVGKNSIRFVMHVTNNNNEYQTVFDSPDQKGFGIKGGKTSFIADSILADIKIMNAFYRGKWDGKDSIVGKFEQGAFKTLLNMKRLTADEIPEPPAPIVRTQTPKQPYGYASEDVEYDNADKSVHYGATLTKPTQGKDFPTVIIISGSGTQDRDGNMFEHKTYAVLADLLTKQGIAVLRVDDRGIGKSTLGPKPLELTSVEFAGDVNNSIQYLLSRNDINKNKIGLVGHSEGGMIAPMVAVKNKQVAFVVLLAGPGQTGQEIWNFQMQRSIEKANLTVDQKKLADAAINNINAAFAKSTDLKTVQDSMRAAFAVWKKNVSDSVEQSLFMQRPVPTFLKLAQQYQSGLYWLNYFLNYHPTENLQKLTIPVLALNGSFDIQVSSKDNLPAIEAALKKGQNKNYQVIEMPKMNHLFQTCIAKEISYESLEESFSPIAANMIGNWILQKAIKN